MSTATEYRTLLLKYLPQPIRSVDEYQRALTQLEKLMVPHPTAAHSRIIELLSTLIENYESREYPTPKVAPSKMLAHLIEIKNIKTADVARGTSIPPATLSNVLANRRGISKRNAIKLGNYFGISPMVFLSDVRPGGKSEKPKRATKKATAPVQSK